MSLYRSGSITAVVRELERYKLDLVSVQGFRWKERGTVRGGYWFFLLKRKRIYQRGTGLFVRHRIVSAGKRVEFFFVIGNNIQF